MTGSPVVTAAEMQAMDRIAIEDVGIAGIVLMENAGRAAAEVVRDLYLEEEAAGPVVILCGSGNNGGDGFVVARYMAQWGIDTVCVLIAPREKVGGDALAQLDIVDTLGIPVLDAAEGLAGTVRDTIESAGLIVDAMFGTGLERPVVGRAAEAIELCNDQDVPVVAVDLPSGISADTGAVLGTAIVADVTVTFGCTKRGLVAFPGRGFAGRVVVADICIPPDVVEHVGPAARLCDDLEPPFLPPRAPDTHKGQQGHVLVVGGSPGKGGAALLAGMGAYRSGAGLVTIATDARCQAALEGRYPELMVEAAFCAADEPGATGLEPLLSGKDAIVIGPGMPGGELGASLLRAAARAGAPLVVDAGALTVLAEHPDILGGASAVVTPHPGEAARCLGASSREVQSDRFGAHRRLLDWLGGGTVVVLKGAGTLVGDAEGPTWVATTGNPGMASGGTGDVLAGMIGALLARGLEPVDAARLGVHVHGLAGDVAAERVGWEGLVATDLLDALPAVLRHEHLGDE